MHVPKFWSQHPALMYGLCALTGSCLALYSIKNSVLFILTSLLGALLVNIRAFQPSFRARLALAVALGCAAFLFAKCYYLLPELDDKGSPGVADVKFTAVKKSKTPFGVIWTYSGILRSFAPHNPQGLPLAEIARNLPITLTLPADSQKERPTAANIYRTRGRLKSKGPGKYSLTVSQSAPWIALKSIEDGRMACQR